MLFTVQALSKALLDLRADMVSQAQSEVLANAEQAAAEINVQRLVDKRTKELQVCSTLIIHILLVTMSVNDLTFVFFLELCWLGWFQKCCGNTCTGQMPFLLPKTVSNN